MKHLYLALLSVLFCGCASSKKTAKTEPIFERPWIGGRYEMVWTPKSAQTNSPSYGKHSALISTLHTNSPLQKAGLQETDLILAVNGEKVRTEKQIHKAVKKTGTSPATFTIYRNGEILEKSVTPGRERFQNWRAIMFGLGLSTRWEFKLWPTPDFSLVALGFDEEPKRLDLQDSKSKFYLAEKARQGQPENQDGWIGLLSDEGRKTWLGPIAFEKRRVIVSQE